MTGITKAIDLVCVVVARRKILATTVDRGVRYPVPMLDAGASKLDVVPRVCLFNTGVMSDAQPKLMSFIEQRGHDIAIHSENLYSVGARLFDLAYARAGFIGVARSRRIAKHRVDEQARRDGFAFRAFVAQWNRLLCVAPDIANRGDAARKPKLQTVIDRLRDSAPLVLNVSVFVYQTWQNVLAGCVDLRIAFRPARPAFAQRNRIKRDYLRDRVAGNHNVFGSRRRSAVTVNNHRVANDQSRITL